MFLLNPDSALNAELNMLPEGSSAQASQAASFEVYAVP